MASEIRVNQIQNRSGLSTVTFTDTGPIISGVTTVGEVITINGADNSITLGTGTTISSPTSDVFVISTNGSVKVKVDSSGNSTFYPGIGVTVSLPTTTTTVAGLAIDQTYTKAQRGEVLVLSDGATITPDFSLANNFSITLGGNRTLENPTNLIAGQSGVIVISQSTGSHTLSYGSYWKFAGGFSPILSTAAGAIDVLSYYVHTSTLIVATLLKDLK